MQKNCHLQQRQQQPSYPVQQQQQECLVCGFSGHNSNKCRYKNYKCNNCKKRGHLKKNYTFKKAGFNKVDNNEANLFSMKTDGQIRINVAMNNIPLSWS